MGDAGSRRTDMSQRGATNPNVIARSEHSKPSSVAEQLAMMPPSSSYGRYDQGAQAGSGRQRGGPFYAQLDGLPPMSRDPSNHSNPGFSRSVQRLDMSALGHALPDATGSSATRPYAGYADSASAHGGPRDMQMQHQPIGAPNMQQYGAPDMSQAGMSPGQPFRHQALQYQYPPHATQFVSPMTMDRHTTGYSMLASPTHSTHAGLQQNFMGAMDARPYSSNSGSSLYSPSGYAGVQRGYERRVSESGPTPSYPRGPPRKPKQSGNALWVGNLPPGTSIIDLKEHFSRGAKREIESLFLISKSNCAFVNYKTEPGCQSAMSKFHDSRFNGVRLVCRLRRGSVASGQSSSQQSDQSRASRGASDMQDGVIDQAPAAPDGIDDIDNVDSELPDQPIDAYDSSAHLSGVSRRVPERFFVVKSLTMQDLEASVRDGIWATQSHNEKSLNKAFDSTDAVYLIFSANKSGEYFGYAKMLSKIDGSALTSNPRAEPHSSDPSDGPTSVPTPETEFAPKGRIIDDSARGTIFWEADRSEDVEVDGFGDNNMVDGASRSSIHEREDVQQDWGKPFRIEWQSTNRLPFYRTRGLRNPWNANREVKIARDGQELESSVGRKLISMFHRPAGGAPPGYSAQMGPPAVAMGTIQGIGRREQSPVDGSFMSYGAPR